MNPFDLRGPEFLLFYLFLAIVVIGLLVLTRYFSEAGDAPKIDLSDPYLIAYLRGGEHGVMWVAMVALIDRGLLVADGTQIERAKNITPDSVRWPIEKVLIEKFAERRDADSIYEGPQFSSACDQLRKTLEQHRLLPDESIALYFSGMKNLQLIFVVPGQNFLGALSDDLMAFPTVSVPLTREKRED